MVASSLVARLPGDEVTSYWGGGGRGSLAVGRGAVRYRFRMQILFLGWDCSLSKLCFPSPPVAKHLFETLFRTCSSRSSTSLGKMDYAPD